MIIKITFDPKLDSSLTELLGLEEKFSTYTTVTAFYEDDNNCYLRTGKIIFPIDNYEDIESASITIRQDDETMKVCSVLVCNLENTLDTNESFWLDCNVYVSEASRFPGLPQERPKTRSGSDTICRDPNLFCQDTRHNRKDQ